ncbi:MAG TPA: DUF1592 domain-containing protein, partial [Polyangia bacterium]
MTENAATIRDGGPGDGGPGDGGDPPRTVLLRLAVRSAVARMTRTLWRAQPDNNLLTQADFVTVTTNLDLLPLAKRVLADGRARVGVAFFYDQWLRLNPLPAKDRRLFPQYTPELQFSMLAEAQAFGVNVTLEEDGLFATLLQAPFSYIDQRLAALYGVAGVTGSNLRKVNLDGDRRAGILTLPAVMAFTSHTALTSPTARSVFISDRLLCRWPLPHPGMPPALAPLAGLSGRGRDRGSAEEKASPRWFAPAKSASAEPLVETDPWARRSPAPARSCRRRAGASSSMATNHAGNRSS